MRLAWYNDEYVRTPDGWRIHRRSTTFMRRSGEFDSGNAHDPARFVAGHEIELGVAMRIGIMIGPETRNYAAKVDRLCRRRPRAPTRQGSRPPGSRSSRRTSTR